MRARATIYRASFEGFVHIPGFGQARGAVHFSGGAANVNLNGVGVEVDFIFPTEFVFDVVPNPFEAIRYIGKAVAEFLGEIPVEQLAAGERFRFNPVDTDVFVCLPIIEGAAKSYEPLKGGRSNPFAENITKVYKLAT